MNTVQRFKLRRIVKALLGTLLKKGWDWFKNSSLVVAIAESPAVMTASGWTIDPKTGKAKQDSFNTPERNKLVDNLAIIGEAAVTAPTVVSDIGALATAVRHPVLTLLGIRKGVPNITLNIRKINRINKEFRKGIKQNSKYIYEEQAEIPIEDSYMYHTWENPHLGFVENGKHYNLERRPGSVKIENGKYISNRFKTNPESDRIWWDVTGHNKGDNVLVTKLGGYKISDLLSGAIPGKGVYSDSYRTTERPNISDVVKFKYDPIGNTYIAYSPFRKITTNKMSLQELFTPE